MDDIRRTLDRVRVMQDQALGRIANGIINEEKGKQEKPDNTSGAIAITDDIKFGDHVLQNQIDAFRSAVDGGAEFAKPDPSSVADCPLIYLPKNGNIVFSGRIPSMQLSFQMVLKTSTGNGLFIWTEGLILSMDNLKVLNKLQGYYMNWKDEWNSAAKELDTLKNM